MHHIYKKFISDYVREVKKTQKFFKFPIDPPQNKYLILALVCNLNLLKSINTLYRNKCYFAARIVLRSLLELSVKAICVASNPKTMIKIIERDELLQKKAHIKGLKKNNLAHLVNRTSNDLEAMLKEINVEKNERRQIRQYFEEAKMDDDYATTYALFSQHVHVNSNALESYYELDSDNIPIAIKIFDDKDLAQLVPQATVFNSNRIILAAGFYFGVDVRELTRYWWKQALDLQTKEKEWEVGDF